MATWACMYYAWFVRGPPHSRPLEPLGARPVTDRDTFPVTWARRCTSPEVRADLFHFLFFHFRVVEEPDKLVHTTAAEPSIQQWILSSSNGRKTSFRSNQSRSDLYLSDSSQMHCSII